MWFIGLHNLRWTELVQCLWSYSVHKNLDVRQEFLEGPDEPMTMLSHIYVARRFHRTCDGVNRPSSCGVTAKFGGTDGWKDRWMGGCKDWWKDGWKNRQTQMILWSSYFPSERWGTIIHWWEHRIKVINAAIVINIYVYEIEVPILLEAINMWYTYATMRKHHSVLAVPGKQHSESWCHGAPFTNLV